MLTDQNMKDLEATSCEQEWNDVCDRIKKEHGGYPSDWFGRVNMSGMMHRISSRWINK